MALVRVVKFVNDHEEQMVFAEVYAPNKPDSDGEYMSADTIKKMAYDFLRDGKTKMVDVQHGNTTTPGVEIVESFIARKGDPDFLAGAWVVGCHIPDSGIWKAVKSGEINGFSIEALVSRVEKEVEVEMPDVVSGRTSKAEDHEHEFFVTYNPEDQSLKGGRTSVVDGHMHVIKGGSKTEESRGHSHRFAALDNIHIVD